jgi:hypothetical protein
VIFACHTTKTDTAGLPKLYHCQPTWPERSRMPMNYMVPAPAKSIGLIMIVSLLLPLLACGRSGAQVPQEVLATRGCHQGNPFDCRVLAVEKVPAPYVHDGTSRETEAWCLVFQAGSQPPSSSLIYLAETTEGQSWIPDFGSKTKFERLGCLQAAEAAPSG